MPSGFSDIVSSLKVYRTEFGVLADGDWVAVTATEGIDFKYTLGFSKVTETETVISQSYDLTMQMTSGISFKVASESETITSEYSESLTYDAKESMEEDITVEYDISCTGQVGAEGGVGLWQWVVRNGSNQFSFTQTKHTVCRYDSLYNVKPACPWNACTNGDCSECKTDWSANSSSQFLQ